MNKVNVFLLFKVKSVYRGQESCRVGEGAGTNALSLLPFYKPEDKKGFVLFFKLPPYPAFHSGSCLPNRTRNDRVLIEGFLFDWINWLVIPSVSKRKPWLKKEIWIGCCYFGTIQREDIVDNSWRLRDISPPTLKLLTQKMWQEVASVFFSVQCSALSRWIRLKEAPPGGHLRENIMKWLRSTVPH